MFSCPSVAVAFINVFLNYLHPEKSLCFSASGIFSYTVVQYVRGMVRYPELQGTVGFLEGIGIWRSGRKLCRRK